jgi:hypothetical protein
MIEIILLLIAGLFGSLATFLINVKYGQGPVKASALISLVFAVLFYFYPFLDSIAGGFSKTIAVVIMGGSFTGMSNTKILPNNWWAAFAGIVFSFIFINWSPYFKGFGGELGTTAALSVIISLGVMRLFKFHIHE